MILVLMSGPQKHKLVQVFLQKKNQFLKKKKKRKLFQTQRVLPCSNAPSPATTFSVTCLEGRPLPGLFVTIIIIIIIIIIVIMKIITMNIIIMIMIQAADQR